MMLFIIGLACVLAAVLYCVLTPKYTFMKPLDTLVVAIVLVPGIFYWFEKQGLTELGIAGFHAKFEGALEKQTQTALDGLDEPIGSTLLLDDDPAALSVAQLHDRHQGPPRGGACLDYLVLRPSLVPQYPAPEFNRYMVFATHTISSSIACGKLIGVVVLDDEDKYVGSYDSHFFDQSLSTWSLFTKTQRLEGMTEGQFDHLAELIEMNTVFGTALRYPRRRIKEGEGYFAFLRDTDTLRDAWKKFQTMRGTFLVVTDHELQFKGFLTRSGLRNLILQELVAL